MSKNGGKGGFWDSLFDNPFGGLFDFNGDGKEDFGEQFLGYKILEDSTKTSSSHSSRLDLGLDSEDSGWRDTAEDGAEFGVFPEDYDSEEEYEDALQEAKYGWRDTVEDGSEYGVDPEDYETEEEYNDALEEARDSADVDGQDDADAEDEYAADDEDEDAGDSDTDAEDEETADSEADAEDDEDDEKKVKESDFPNKRRYEAAVVLAGERWIYIGGDYEKREKARCKFILEDGDKVLAANYLTHDGDFLFSQAVKDNFKLPITLPDEDESSEFALIDILLKIEKKDISLTLTVWEWCIEQFLPYADYAPGSRAAMTDYLVGEHYDFSEEFQKSFHAFLDAHPVFREKIIREADEIPGNLGRLIADMIRDGYFETAKAIFGDALALADGKWKLVNHLMGGVILFAKDEEELETIEFVEANFLPKMRTYSDGMILDEIEGWEKEIAKHKAEVERSAEKYAYARINEWRNHVPDGSQYGLNPRYYDSEQEYLDAYMKEKYAWRDRCARRETYGLDPAQFETEEEYDAAWQQRRDEAQEKEREKREEYRRAMQEKREQELAERRAARKELEAALLQDKTIYTYCGVELPYAPRPYSFRTEDESIEIGDAVVVPVGEDNKEVEGTVVSVGRYMRVGVPYPVDKTKFIIRKTEKK